MITLVLNTDATTEHTLVLDYRTEQYCLVDPFGEMLTPNNTQACIRFTKAVSEATISYPYPEEGTFVLRNAFLFQGILRSDQTVSMTQQNNVMIGYGSGGETIGHHNCFVGNDTNVLQGQRNIVIGHENRLLSGTNNIIIGHDVSHSVKNDTLVIGSLIEGDFVNLSLRLNASVEVTHELNAKTIRVGEAVQAPTFTDGFLNIARGNIETGNVTISSESVQAPTFTDGVLKITRGELQIPQENVALYFEDGSFKYRLHNKVYRIMSVEEV